VTVENGDIGDDEPVVVFRARDVLLPQLMSHYKGLCVDAGSPDHHLDLVLESRRKIIEWQKSNHDLIRVPKSGALARGEEK
jgi:hypothetical protein